MFGCVRSSRWNNVGKGSRQNGSVTSGKGLALRAGSVGLRREACGREVGWRSVAAPSLLPFARGRWMSRIGEAGPRSVGAWTGANRASPAVARVGRRPTTHYYVLRSTNYYVLRTTYNYVLSTTYYYVLRTITYNVLCTTTNYVLRTTTYYRC